MFHLQSLELLHWDYCQRVTMPLDGAIITIAGPNGSGKTTLLDAMRTLLGLECSGGRTYKTYARHANADTAWLRATVDNSPRGRQNSSRPFASSLLYSDQVTLACRIERHGGDWQRRYMILDGVQTIEQLAERGVSSMIYYPIPLHKQKAFASDRHKPGNFPVTEKLCASVLSLPMHTELDEETLQYITKTVLELI